MPAGAIPFPFGDCRVCADKATGVHYGVATCEGCKGFFKRSISKADKYKCFYQGQCTLSPQERNRCKSCRFHRCLEVGMSIDGVKMGRIPKLEKEKALQEYRKELHAKSDIRQTMTSCSAESIHPVVSEYKSCYQWCPNNLKSSSCLNQCLTEQSTELTERYHGSSSDSGIDNDLNVFQDVQDKEQVPVLEIQGIDSDAFRFGVSIKAGNKVSDVKSGHSMCHDHLEVLPSVSTTGLANLFASDSGSFTNSICNSFEKINDQNSICNSFEKINDCPASEKNSHISTVLIPSDSFSGKMASDAGHVTSSSKLIPADNTMMPISKILSSPSPQSSSPFYPTVIRELLNQVIETGHARQLQHSLVRQFLSASSDWQPELWIKNLSSIREGKIECLNKQLQDSIHSESYLLASKRKAEAEHAEDDTTSWKKKTFSSQETRHSCLVDDEEIVVCNGSNMNAQHPMYTNYDSQTASVTSLFSNMSQIMMNGEELLIEKSESDAVEGLDRPTVYTHKLSVEEDLEKVEDIKTLIPGASCPDRFQRMQNLEAMAGLVPQLTFWDIPENTLGPTSLLATDQSIEVEQCKNEIEEVLEWLDLVGYKFTEKSKLDFAIWEEEVKGLRPLHPFNLLTKLTQKDIGIFWEEVVACIPLCNFLILGLCSSIPGFNQLESEDRAILMEAAYFDVWMILLSSVFRDGDCFLRLVCEARYSRFWMQVFMPEKLVSGMFYFAEELNSCNLTACEQIILCAIQLTSKEHDRLKNHKRVQQLHDYYLDLLAYQIQRNHKSNHSRILLKIFQILPILTPISREQLELTSMLSVNQPPDVPCIRTRNT